MTTSPAPSLKRAAEDDRDVSPPPVKRTAKQNAAVNFFKPLSQKEPEKITWAVRDNSLIIAKYRGATKDVKSVSKGARVKIAAFDFDSTLVKSKTNKKYSYDVSDWMWWDQSVPSKLRKLHEDGYIVAIISNQGGISLRSDPKTPAAYKKRHIQFKEKATSVFNQLNVPLNLYAATEHDNYRKPRSGMWTALLEDYRLSADGVDMQASIFVGDAAGRVKDGQKPADFSCSDRDLADNLGLPFQTPEEFFLGEPAKEFARSFEPSAYLQPALSESTSRYTKIHPLDLVIFVGSPGSGKSTFFKAQLEPLGYHRVNQDILRRRERCVEVAREHLEQGESVAVDNTNRDTPTRKVWIDLARTFNIPIRCVYFSADPALCQHNDAVRAMNAAHNPESRTMLPKNAFWGYKKDFQPPELKEGFEDITQVDFLFDGTDEERAEWTKYWT